MVNPVKDSYDFIVVGGGTAGNVVAGRLAENPNVKILVIEAGPGNPDEIPEITTPSRAFELRNSRYDWAYQTTFVDNPDYERVEKPNTHGKVLGGGSCLNYYTWIRGSKATFDAWGEYGGKAWTWGQCKDYFDKSATYHDDDRLYDPKFSRLSQGGPLHISHADLVTEIHPFRDALTRAWTSKGQVLKEDVYSGVRSSSAVFVAGKSNVEVMHSAIGRRINFEGNAAVGVTILGPDDTETTFNATKDIIIAGGVFETPKILLLSGIGPKRELAHHGIMPVVESEHVGENLLDHPILPHVFRLNDGMGLDKYLLRDGPAHDAAVEQYHRDKTGPLASGLLEMIALPRIDSRLEKYEEYREAKAKNGGKDPFGPEGQSHFEIDFVPMFADAFQWHFPVPSEGDWLTVIVDLVRPQSRNGFVPLNSVDSRQQPYINLNYFSNELDILALKEGVRFIDDILMNGEGMKDIIGEDYPWPMPRDSDEEMDRVILDRSQTGFHPCGTTRLSQDIKQGVVDPELRVHGTKNLRVIDASIIPVLPDCRIQNAVYMIGEKGADIIKDAHPSLYKGRK